MRRRRAEHPARAYRFAPRAEFLHFGSPEFGGYDYELLYDLNRGNMRHERNSTDYPGFEGPGRVMRGGFEARPSFRTYGAPDFYPEVETRLNRGYDRGYLEDFDYDREGRGWWNRASDEIASWFGDEDAEFRRELDAFYDGNRGRGPKGYVRSDVRISEDINDRLTDDYYVDATDINVMVSKGEVTMNGSVPSLSAKRRAEDIALGVAGVINVEDRMKVDRNFYHMGETDASTGKARAASG